MNVYEVGGTCSIYREDEKYIKNVDRKTTTKETAWEDNKMDLRKIVCEGVNWTQLAVGFREINYDHWPKVILY
jgi:hypothetical protein